MEQSEKNKVITLSEDNLQIIKQALFHYASFLHKEHDNPGYKGNLDYVERIERIYKKCIECYSTIKKQESTIK